MTECVFGGNKPAMSVKRNGRRRARCQDRGASTNGGLTLPSRLSTIVAVGRCLRRSAGLIILAAMLGGHVTELFDHWDNTPESGRDIDYTIVILAACAGVVVLAAKRFVALFRQFARRSDLPMPQSFSLLEPILLEISALGPSPPPLLPLRV